MARVAAAMLFSPSGRCNILLIRQKKSHPVFHVSMLRKSEKRIGPSIVDYQDLEILTDVSVEERPIRISDRREQVLRGKVIPLVKVHWTHRGDEEATWEREDLMREQYPEAFPDAGTILISRTKFL